MPLTPPAPAPISAPAAPTILSTDDVSLYKDIMAAERDGKTTRAKILIAKLTDTSLVGYAQAQGFLSASPRNVTIEPLVEWLTQYRDLPVADRIYRLAVAHSTKKIRKHRKTITVAVVTNIPAPTGVGRRTGGYEDQELPEPMPVSEETRAVMPGILAAIKTGNPDQAEALMQPVLAGRLAVRCPGNGASDRRLLSRRGTRRRHL